MEKTIEEEEAFWKLKFKVGQILAEEFLKWNDGKFHTAIELNPATHALTEFCNQQVSEYKEKLKKKIQFIVNSYKTNKEKILDSDIKFYHELRIESLECIIELIDSL